MMKMCCAARGDKVPKNSKQLRKSGSEEENEKLAKKSKSEESGTVSGGEQTLNISCTMLILECKVECAGRGDRLTAQLDELYANYKAKKIDPSEALAQLHKLVGTTTVEQAALVLHNELSAACDLKPGWIEYIEPTKQARPCPPARPARHRRDALACERQVPYYHNPRTKETTWTKPSKPKQGWSDSIKNFFDKPVVRPPRRPPAPAAPRCLGPRGRPARALRRPRMMRTGERWRSSPTWRRTRLP